MRCQRKHCLMKAKLWMTKGGVTLKVCVLHATDLENDGWVEREHR